MCSILFYLKWDQVAENVLQNSPENVGEYFPKNVMEYSPENVMKYSPENVMEYHLNCKNIIFNIA